MSEQTWIREEEAALRLDCCARNVRRFVADGRIRRARCEVTGRVFVSAADVDALAATRLGRRRPDQPVLTA